MEVNHKDITPNQPDGENSVRRNRRSDRIDPDQDGFVDMGGLFTVRLSGPPQLPGKDRNGREISPFAAPDDAVADRRKSYCPPLPEIDELSYLEYSCEGTPASLIDIRYVREEAYRQEIERKKMKQSGESETDEDARLADTQARLATITKKTFRPLAAKMEKAFTPRQDKNGNVMYDAFGIPVPSPLFRLIPYKGNIEDLWFVNQEQKAKSAKEKNKK